MADQPLSDPQRAAIELLRRQRARNSLVEYARSIDIPGAPAVSDPDTEHFKPVETSLALHHRVILEAIQRTVTTPFGRLMIFAPPGSAKSSYASVVTPSWLLAKNPGYRIIIASYATKIAAKHSRKARALCRQDRHVSIWPDRPILANDQKAVDQWALSNGSEFMAAGLLAGITGNRANGILIDDPVANREEADSPTIQDKVEAEYIDSASTRLLPGGWIIVIQCMTGDTRVLMADGTERRLDQIRPGDQVASYSDGVVVPAKVLNWTNQGPDRTLAIRMKSGRVVRANERHPFLVDRDGERTWTKLRDLRPGDRLVCAREPGEGSSASSPAVTLPPSARGAVCPTTTHGAGAAACGPLPPTRDRDAQHTFGTDTESTSTTTRQGSRSNAACAPCAGSHPGATSGRIGEGNSASITTTRQGRSEDCCATIATSLSDTARSQQSCCAPLNIYAITLDTIESIDEDGVEDVFDIQVEGTENFIANGLVSHNTRWNENDLSGRTLPEDYQGESGRVLCRDGKWWEVINIPAKAEREDDPLGRKIGEYLWPEWFPVEHWAQWEHNPRAARTWASLYQQRPTAGEGIEFKREWFKWYDPDIEPGKPGGRPVHLTIYGASDYATQDDKGDYSEHGIVGIGESKLKMMVGDKPTTAAPFYFLDWWYGQKTTDISIDAFTSLVHRWTPRRWWHEGGPIDKAISPAVKRAMREHVPPVHVSLEPLTLIQSKAVKLASFQARAAAGLVYLPLNRPWATRLLDQLCAFPAGKHDDAADVCGLIGRGVDAMMSPHAPAPQARAQLLPFTEAWLMATESEPMQARYS